jgi:transketolase
MVNSRYILTTEPTEKKDTRSGFGAGLLEAGKHNANVVALCADLTGSLKMGDFQKAFPERFYQVGIAKFHLQAHSRISLQDGCMTKFGNPLRIPRRTSRFAHPMPA